MIMNDEWWTMNDDWWMMNDLDSLLTFFIANVFWCDEIFIDDDKIYDKIYDQDLLYDEWWDERWLMIDNW